MDPIEDPAGGAILYVDGDVDRTTDTVDRLERAGLTVRTATDTESALRLVDDVVAVVAEHDPPSFDGFACLLAIEDGRPELPRVLFPTGGDEATAADAVDADFEGYVPRHGTPAADASRLVRKVEDLLVDAELADVDFEIKEQAMDEAPVGITLADANRPNEPLVYVNESFVELTGYDRSDIIGRNCRFLQGDDSNPEAVARMRAAIEAEEPVSVELVNYDKDGEPFWNRVDIAPIRNEDGDVDYMVGFQTDISERVRAEQRAERRAEELAEERAALERLIDRINGVIGDVTAALVEATDRESVEHAVCERLVDAAPYVGAWIGEIDHTTDAVRPTASAGADASSLEIPLAGTDPVARAIEERSLQRSEPLSAAHEAAAPAAATAMAVVPLVYRESVHGVLVTYAAGEDAFDDRETAVVGAVGRAVATTLNALRTRRIIEADAVVELELGLTDRNLFFVDAATRSEGRLQYAGTGYGPEGDQRLLFSVEGALIREVIDALADHREVAEVTGLTTDDDGGLLEVAPSDPSFVTLLAEHGAETESLTAEPGRADLTVRMASDDEARSLVDLLEERYDGTDLKAYRQSERPPKTRREFLSAVDEQLTERQRTALQKAFAGGYFDRRRSVTGDDLAASMDISRSTFHQHLRAAQRKLLDEFFERR